MSELREPDTVLNEINLLKTGFKNAVLVLWEQHRVEMQVLADEGQQLDNVYDWTLEIEAIQEVVDLHFQMNTHE